MIAPRGFALSLAASLCISSAAHGASGIVLCLRDGADLAQPLTLFGSRDALEHMAGTTDVEARHTSRATYDDILLLRRGRVDGFVFFDGAVQETALGRTGSWTDHFLDLIAKIPTRDASASHRIETCALVLEVETYTHKDEPKAFQLCTG